MNREQLDELSMALYQVSSALQNITMSLSANGVGESAAHCRQAGGDVMQAIAKLVRMRDEARAGVLS